MEKGTITRNAESQKIMSHRVCRILAEEKDVELATVRVLNRKLKKKKLF